MIISSKTAEKLRDLINEETEYRTGSKLVSFFNQCGSRDIYGRGFPSRREYTDGKIRALNGTPNLDKCIRNLFSPVNFIGRFTQLDELIESFNQYLNFDGWSVVRNGQEIMFSKAKGVDVDREKEKEQKGIISESAFLNENFEEVSIEFLPIDNSLRPYVKARIDEISLCLSAKAYLSVIFLAGSTLEGILLGVAQSFPAEYNQAKSAPRDQDSKVCKLHEWKLAQLIDASRDVGFLKEDVRKFSHSLRDFRNYIHPFQQMSEKFAPDENSARICIQVLKAALCQIVQRSRR